MRTLELPYGHGRISARIPGGFDARWCAPKIRVDQRPAREQIADALRSPIGAPPLAELARGAKSATILIPGKERVAGVADYVPALIAELREGGISDDSISIVLATGTHEHHGEDDLKRMLGSEVFGRFRCHSQDCKNPDVFASLGSTSRGTPVQFSKHVLAADLKILTGRIVPHYFAGFSGGRKALLPGVAAWPTIVANHRRTLDPSHGVAKNVACCQLEGNPVHLDMAEAASRVPGTYCLNTIFDAEHQMAGVVAGDAVAAHAEGCRLARELCQQIVPEPLDGIITSAGGDPYDTNFMQALKAAFNTQTALRDGGAMLWIAECKGGMHPGFLPWARIADDDELEASVRRDYNLTGHNSIMLRHLVRRVRVAFLGSLPRDDVRQMGFHPVADLDEGIDWLASQLGATANVAVVPLANIGHLHVAANGSGNRSS